MQLDLAIPETNLWAISPEITLAVAGIFAMLYNSLRPRDSFVTTVASLIGLILSAVFLFNLWNGQGFGTTSWNGMISTDNLRISFSFVLIIVSTLTLLSSSVWLEREKIPAGEYHALLLFATFGMLLMAAGNDLVVIFLGLETSSIATYVLAGLRRNDPRSNESAMKYFILGSFASAFLLYGMALVYGATGSTNIAAIADRITDANFPALLIIGAAMMIVGFGFKIAMAPFHIWTPDVYEGAPAPITGFMAGGPKAAAFASFLRVMITAFPFVPGIAASSLLHDSWITALAVLSIISMTFGNVAAILQDNVKRMLAYSSIAHAGYALIGFIGAGVAKNAADREEAMAGVAFYLLAYAVTNLGAFAIVALLADKNDRRSNFEDYYGIGFRSPLISFTLSLFMLSLLGMPLTAGFIGKVLVFRPALEAGNPLLAVAVVAAVINTAISAYYYLRLIVVMFFRERTADWAEPKVSLLLAAALIFTAVGVLYLGIFSSRIIESFSNAPQAIIMKK
jgi:NADH-quinone oxidoreductase subunit N